MDNALSLAQFLYFGYGINGEIGLPDPVAQSICDSMPAKENGSRSLEAWVREGVCRLYDAFTGSLDSLNTSITCLVPLSGGLDSRAILGGLLKNVDRVRVHTVTFGLPGAWDYEIGKRVAQEAGVKNTAIDLSAVPWTTEALLRFARKCDCVFPLFEAYLFHLIRCLDGPPVIIWSGFMGDALSGSHLLKNRSQTWESARSEFASKNRYVRSVDMSPPNFNASICLPSAPLVESLCLDYDDQLDFVIRQQCYIKPIVLLKGYEYRTPFLRPEWMRFILQTPRSYRVNQRLYKEILKVAYPRLFSLPVTNSLGLSIDAPVWRIKTRRAKLRIRRTTNCLISSIFSFNSPNRKYIDFDHNLRERKDLKTVVYEAIQDLKRRRIVDWIDVDDLWCRHQKGLGNHADALTLLASLEIKMKAEEAGL